MVEIHDDCCKQGCCSNKLKSCYDQYLENKNHQARDLAAKLKKVERSSIISEKSFKTSVEMHSRLTMEEFPSKKNEKTDFVWDFGRAFYMPNACFTHQTNILNRHQIPHLFLLNPSRDDLCLCWSEVTFHPIYSTNRLLFSHISQTHLQERYQIHIIVGGAENLLRITFTSLKTLAFN